jgi:hypothetical protein
MADDLASRHERIATFRDGASDDSHGGRAWSSVLQTTLDSASVHEPAARDYWHGRYDALTSSSTAREHDDAASLLIAANATFRQVQREAGGRLLTVDELDRALQAYAGVLKNGGFERDAAWNYEYIARLRDNAAKEKPARQPGRASGSPGPTVEGARAGAAQRPARQDTSGLPAGPTIHGRPGTHPPSTKGEEFEVITPMDYGDREAQPEPTPGVKLPRKG